MENSTKAKPLGFPMRGPDLCHRKSWPLTVPKRLQVLRRSYSVTVSARPPTKILVLSPFSFLSLFLSTDIDDEGNLTNLSPGGPPLLIFFLCLFSSLSFSLAVCSVLFLFFHLCFLFFFFFCSKDWKRKVDEPVTKDEWHQPRSHRPASQRKQVL